MIPEALEQKIVEAKQNGYTPFFVCCTAGTTVYGSFDPINDVADICEKHKMWLHVDVSSTVSIKKQLPSRMLSFQAAWGGGLLLSPKHRHLLSGIER